MRIVVRAKEEKSTFIIKFAAKRTKNDQAQFLADDVMINEKRKKSRFLVPFFFFASTFFTNSSNSTQKWQNKMSKREFLVQGRLKDNNIKPYHCNTVRVLDPNILYPKDSHRIIITNLEIYVDQYWLHKMLAKCWLIFQTGNNYNLQLSKLVIYSQQKFRTDDEECCFNILEIIQ